MRAINYTKDADDDAASNIVTVEETLRRCTIAREAVAAAAGAATRG